MQICSTPPPKSINQNSPHFKYSPVSYVSTTTPKQFLPFMTKITSTTMLSHQISICVHPQLAYQILSLPSHRSSTGTLLISLPITPPSDLLFVTLVLSFLSPAPHTLPLSLPIQPLICSFCCHSQVYLLVMLWTWFCWFTFSRPACSIEIEEKKRIVFLGLNRCYPIDFWFSGKFEMNCFDLK